MNHSSTAPAWWRPGDTPHETPHAARPTHEPARDEVPSPLSARERRALLPLREVYPHLEYVTTRREWQRLLLLRWLVARGAITDD